MINSLESEAILFHSGERDCKKKRRGERGRRVFFARERDRETGGGGCYFLRGNDEAHRALARLRPILTGMMTNKNVDGFMIFVRMLPFCACIYITSATRFIIRRRAGGALLLFKRKENRMGYEERGKLRL